MAVGIGLMAVLALFSVVIAYYSARQLRLRYFIRKFDGPLPLPIVGTTYTFHTDPREAFVNGIAVTNKYREKTGGIIAIWLGPVPCLEIYGAQHMEVILSSSQHISKGFGYKFLEPWLGKGLLTSTGEKWFHRRKMLTPTFHFSILKHFVDVFDAQSSILVKKLTRLVDTSEPVNMFPLITSCVLDIICVTAMGKHINAQAGGENEYVKAVKEMSKILSLRGKYPQWWPDFIFNRTSYGQEHARCLKILHDVTNKMIQERLHDCRESENRDDIMIDGKQRKVAFLDLLLQMHLEDKSFTLKDIQEEVDTFMFEGHDTTAAAISWALYLIGRHPDVQTRLHEEIDEIFGGSGRPVAFDDLPNLPYLNYVVKEALRIFPSVPAVVRSLSDDIILDGKLVPKETTIVLDIRNLHHDPVHFPDPDRFDPDRFLPENVAKRHPYAYVPFSAGPRNCIGQKFALLEDKVVLVNLLRKFWVESLQTVEEAKPAGQLIIRPAHGKLLFKLTMRKG